MKRREISIVLILFLIALNLGGINFQSNFMHIITFPYAQIGNILRIFSQSENIGNIVAWILYLLVSLSPILYLKFIKKEKSNNDYMLIIYSLCLFVFIYFWINPGLVMTGILKPGFSSLFQLIIAAILHSILLIYVISEFMRKIDQSKDLSVLRLVLSALTILQYVLLFVVFGILLSEFVFDISSLDFNYVVPGYELFIIFFKFITKALPYVLSILLISRLIYFVEDHYRNPYSDENILTLESISKSSYQYLLISLVMIIIYLGSLLIFNELTTIALQQYQFSIPVFSIILMVLILLLNKLYQSNKAIFDENKGFI